MQEKLLCPCRERGGDRHDSEFAVEGLVKEGLLQFLQGGEFAFVGASEVLGFYAQVAAASWLSSMPASRNRLAKVKVNRSFDRCLAQPMQRQAHLIYFFGLAI